MIKDVHINNPKPLLEGGSNSCRTGSFAQSFPDCRYILETVVAGKVREIAIARNVGDSVLYHSIIGLATCLQEVLGRLPGIATIRSSKLPPRNAPNEFRDTGAFFRTYLASAAKADGMTDIRLILLNDCDGNLVRATRSNAIRGRLWNRDVV
jgi:hypothetical protein